MEAGLLLLFIVLLLSLDFSIAKLTLVSILNKDARDATLIKLHSVVQSSDIANIHFGFVIFESENFTVSEWNAELELCFLGKTGNDRFSYSSLRWEPNHLLIRLLTHKRFETELIFSRFYLPIIFPTAERILYLDNDIIVTANLAELLSTPMIGTSGKPAPAGFVFEKSIFNEFYMRQHLNFNHSLVQQASAHRGGKVFLNCGVILFDAILWRERNLTAKAEELIKANAGHPQRPLYDNVIGDQGTFFLLLQDDAANLPVRYNLRRHPTRSIKLLENSSNITGVLHFAGTAGGFSFLCKYPTHFPILISTGIPLLLSVVHSFQHVCPRWNTTRGFAFCNVEHAMKSLSDYYSELGDKAVQIVEYNPGRGLFSFPPKKMVVLSSKTTTTTSTTTTTTLVQ